MNSPLIQLGFTRAGKPIAQPIKINGQSQSDDLQHYTTSDHFDAYALFQYLTSRELRLNGRNAPSLSMYMDATRFHLEKLPENVRLSEMKALSLITIFDILQFGKRLADSIFDD